MQQAVAEKTEAHNRTATELMRSKLIGEVGLERERMAAELERLKHQLSNEERHRVQLQENLKRVFMRGVCALNFEAMTLLNPASADVGATSTGGMKENVAPPLNQVGFDWANFESQKTALGSNGANAPGLASGDPKGEAAIPDSGRSSEGLPEVKVDVASMQEPSLKSREAQVSPQEQSSQLMEAHESPRSHPPRPVAAPPNSSKELEPLPYVNYAGPESDSPEGPTSKSSPAKSTAASPAKSPSSIVPKERRWQTATSGARFG